MCENQRGKLFLKNLIYSTNKQAKVVPLFAFQKTLRATLVHSKQLICISLFTFYHSKHILSCACHKRTLFSAYCREWFLQENNLFLYKLYFFSHVFLVTEPRQVSEVMTSCSFPLLKTAGYIYSSQFWNPSWFQSHLVHYSVPQCNPLSGFMMEKAEVERVCRSCIYQILDYS